jgi:hypothetical protein
MAHRNSLLGGLLAAPLVLAGFAGFAPRASATDPVEADPGSADPEPAWSTSLELYAFDPPEEDAYLSPVIRIDRGAWHFEGRYQYEDLDTASFFAGRTFSWGEGITLDLVPMVGIVLGDTDGVAPALEAELAWRALSWYSESEYVIDTDDADDSFFLVWSELTISPAEWLRVGLVGQRTRAREQDLEVDRGLLLGVTAGRVGFHLYWFNIDRDDPYAGLAVSFGG